MGDLRWRVLSVLAVTLLVGAASPAAGAFQVAQAQPDADNTATQIQVSENGTATWTVRIRTRLTTSEDVDQFQAFQLRVRNDSGRALPVFRDRMRGVVGNAANATRRDMAAENFTISTRIQEVPRRWGVVVYEFTWTNFAVTRSDSGAVVVSDVFGAGFFIAANDTLSIAGPPGYGVDTVSPEPDHQDDGTLTWDGRVDFGDNRPRVRYVPTSETTSTALPPGESATPNGSTVADGDSNSTDGQDVGDSSGQPLSTVLGMLVILGALAVAGLLYRRRAHDGTTDPSADGTGEAAAADTPRGMAGASDVPGDEADELLTDGDRVRNLLEERDGRVRQKEIVEAFDWTDSKTSRVVSRLSDEGAVEKLRIGRENVISLPDSEEE